MINLYKKLITLISAISVLFGSLFFPSLAFAEGATLSFSPSSGNISPNCSFTVSILVSTGGRQTDGTDAIFNYDPAKLTTSTEKITKGTIYESYPANSIEQSSGKITISGLAAVGQPFLGENGKLATVEFTVKPDAPTGPTTLTYLFTRGVTTDSNVVERGTISDILGQVSNASFNITNSTCSVPTATAAPGLGGTIPGSTNNTLTRSRGATGTIVDENENGIDDSSESGTIIKKPPVLNDTAITIPTLIFAIGGGLLTILGILGLALL